MTFGEGVCDFCQEYREVVDRGAVAICRSCARSVVIAFAARGSRRGRKAPRTVHRLVGAQPACGFTDAPYGEWPPGHVGTRQGEDVTCRHCLQVGCG